MAKKAIVESASTEVLDEILAPKAPKKKAKPITEPEPKTLDEIGEMAEKAIAEAEALNEVEVAEPSMPVEEKVAIIDEIKENTKKINEVMNNNPEEGIKLVEAEIERVGKVETKLKEDKKKQKPLNRVIYTWNGIQF